MRLECAALMSRRFKPGIFEPGISEQKIFAKGLLSEGFCKRGVGSLKGFHRILNWTKINESSNHENPPRQQFPRPINSNTGFAMLQSRCLLNSSWPSFGRPNFSGASNGIANFR
jgi:hypothetical protein